MGRPRCILFAFRRFMRAREGAAAVEVALGMLVFVVVSALCFDLYSRVRAHGALGRIATTVGEYVSREDTPDGNELTSLAEFLFHHELGVPADLVVVITAFRRNAGQNNVSVLWFDRRIRFGHAATTAALARGCSQFARGNSPALPDGFEMVAGTVLIVTEVCARLARQGSYAIGSDIHRHYAVPFRNTQRLPDRPFHGGLVPKDALEYAARRPPGSGVDRPTLATVAGAWG